MRREELVSRSQALVIPRGLPFTAGTIWYTPDCAHASQYRSSITALVYDDGVLSFQDTLP